MTGSPSVFVVAELYKLTPRGSQGPGDVSIGGLRGHAFQPPYAQQTKSNTRLFFFFWLIKMFDIWQKTAQCFPDLFTASRLFSENLTVSQPCSVEILWKTDFYLLLSDFWPNKSDVFCLLLHCLQLLPNRSCDCWLVTSEVCSSRQW